jgi:hypothetical protein
VITLMSNSHISANFKMLMSLLAASDPWRQSPKLITRHAQVDEKGTVVVDVG